jgi:hypothetical protein
MLDVHICTSMMMRSCRGLPGWMKRKLHPVLRCLRLRRAAGNSAVVSADHSWQPALGLDLVEHTRHVQRRDRCVDSGLRNNLFAAVVHDVSVFTRRPLAIASSSNTKCTLHTSLGCGVASGARAADARGTGSFFAPALTHHQAFLAVDPVRALDVDDSAPQPAMQHSVSVAGLAALDTPLPERLPEIACASTVHVERPRRQAALPAFPP